MADILSHAQRSRLMANVHGKDTSIEKKVRSYLHNRGYRFRKHVTGLPGSPDIVMPRYKATIFIHGCFWHGHAGCTKSRLPTTRHTFWEEKRRANLERDARKLNELLNLGWRAAIIWQCGLEKTATFAHSMKEFEDWLNSDSTRCEIPADEVSRQTRLNTILPS
jgi:DNA mismatch endonuclease (patch repair protein)